MTLNKFFRKHSRTLILVVMSLLAVVFVVGDAVGNRSGGGGGRDLDIGKAFGEIVSTADLRRADADLELAESLRFGGIVQGTDDRSLLYYLLSEEARRMGIRVGRPQVEEALKQRGVTGEMIADLRQRTRRSIDGIYEAVGRYLAVEEAFRLQAQAIQDSTPRVQLTYRDVEERAEVKLSVLDARAFVDQVDPPSDALIEAHFEEYRSVPAGPTAEDFGFGYLVEPRVQLEYLTVDPRKIAPEMRVRESEAREFFRQNRESYVTFERVENPAPGERPVRRVLLEYDLVKDKVREDKRMDKAIQEANRLINRIRNELNAPWLAAQRDEQGFRTAPDAGTIRSMEEIAEQYSTTYTVRYVKTPLITQSELQGNADLGRALYATSRQQITAPELAFRVKGIFAPDENENLPVLNVFEPSPVFRGAKFSPENQRQIPQPIVFRVSEVAPAGPAPLADAREQVEEDLRLLAAYEQAEQVAQELAETARNVGLENALAELDELKQQFEALDQASTQPAGGGVVSNYARMLGPLSLPTFSRQSTFIQYLERPYVERVRNLIFETIEQQDEDQVLVIGVPGSYKWIVAQIVDVAPLYAGDFEQRRDQIRQQNRQVELQAFIEGWFDPENIKLRADYRELEPENV